MYSPRRRTRSISLEMLAGIVLLLVVLAFLLGFLLGGTVGAGTIVCIALVGPVAGIFLPINEKLVRRILDKTMTAA